MVTIAAPYEMMVTDVTNAQYAPYLNEALAKGAVKIDGDSVVGYYPGEQRKFLRQPRPVRGDRR
jgi:hypothetical protein